MKRMVLLVSCCLIASAPAAAQSKRPITVDDLFRFKRVADPQISPDGKQVAYVVTAVDLPGNKTASAIWLAPSDGSSPPRQLTNAPGKKDRHPRWRIDSKRVLFESNRSGTNQLWVVDMTGGEARQLTDIATGAGTGIWSPDGNYIAFVSAVWPEYSEKPYKESNDLNKKRMDEREKNPVKAKVFKRMFFRHWDEYVEDKRQHLFVMPFDPGHGASHAYAEPKDVTPGDRDAYPTSTTFSIGDDYTFSPDSKYLVFTAVPEKDEAWSTNYDICRVPITGGTTKWECLTTENAAADGAPKYSSDGKLLAYRAQKRPGFEADRWQLLIVGTTPDGKLKGKPNSLTDGAAGFFDGSPESFVWTKSDGEGQTIYFTAEQKGASPIFFQIFVANEHELHAMGESKAYLAEGNSNSSLSIAGSNFPVFLRGAYHHPPEVLMLGDRGKVRNLSSANTAILAELDLARPESVTVEGAGGVPMQMWILKPPGFDEKKKWPLVYLVHGGPQGAWTDDWSFRWNPQVWAAQGYVVALPNPRGSTGFGQKYVDEISGDWGGKCYEDLMKGVEYLEKLPYIDKNRMAAAGASFGGYMMNWFAGHTDKFKTLITHCGVYNFDSMYALTEELWFDEWEHGGPPWLKRDSYEKHSPHKFAKNFKTPMLIIHNDLDFRVPVAEGLQLFTTLQRLGVPSKMINFPDEGHWVLKPANSKYWHEEVFAWLKKYAPPGGR